MNSRAFSVHAAAPSRTFSPILVQAPVAYEVKNLVGSAHTYLCNAVTSASYTHIGNGWTRVSIPARDERILLSHLVDFGHLYRRLP